MSEAIFDPTRVTTKAEFAIHTKASEAGVREYIYAKANGAISVGAVCNVDSAGEADELDSANAATINGQPLGVAQVAIANDSYGWLQVYGPCAAIQVAGAVSKGDYIWGTTTDGAIDDADVANANLRGITVNARSSAGNTSGFLTYPTVQGNE